MENELHLIPVPLGSDDPVRSLAPCVIDTVREIDFFIVENRKSAFRFLSRVTDRAHLDRIETIVLDEHTNAGDAAESLAPALSQMKSAVLSEAGMPCVADPGALAVREARKRGMNVLSWPGPSSILQALAASGLSGQRFAFHGYLPQDQDGRIREIKLLEKTAVKTGSSEIFIETPYRNDRMAADLIRSLSPATRLMIAADLMQEDEYTACLTVAEWREKPPVIGKRPCIFIIGT